MNTKQVIYQRPAPKIVIKDSTSGNVAKLIDGTEMIFSPVLNKNLLSYSFTLSLNDISGSFSATFMPDYTVRGKTYSLFDDIKKLQIVEIYEGDGESTEKPVFTGIIRTKKYVAQANDGGGNRRISISGTAITGLVSQFSMTLDVSACAITGQLKSNADLIKKLTINAGDNSKIVDILKSTWECFLQISRQLGTPEIEKYISRFMGGVEEVFDCGDLTIFYPLACLFQGQVTTDFFSIVDDILPNPVYEKFPYMAENGKMRIKVREVPFSATEWNELSKNKKVISSNILQSFDLTESDAEVYTSFYAYLNGYPVDEQKSLVISTLDNSGVDTTLKHSPKFAIYGYRPMNVSFIGYSKNDGEDDKDTAQQMQEKSQQLMDWYKDLPDMLKGSITLSLVFGNDINRIQPGQVVQFLTGEFYVDAVTHNWGYGGGGQINLSVSRGGMYSEGKFIGKIRNITDVMKLLFQGSDVQSVSSLPPTDLKPMQPTNNVQTMPIMNWRR